MAESTVAPIPQHVLDSDVMTQLEKAEACRELPVLLIQDRAGVFEGESKAWLEHIAVDALGDALDQVEAEYVKRAREAT